MKISEKTIDSIAMTTNYGGKMILVFYFYTTSADLL